MKSFLHLPAGYQESFRVDLQKNKKQSIIVNVLSVVILALVVGAGLLMNPYRVCFKKSMMPLVLVVVGLLVYTVLHELIHGIFIRVFSGTRPHYGFTGGFAYARSEAYFSRTHYIIIALSPVILLGTVLAVLCVSSWGTQWFWALYLLEAFNLSGAAGDFYVTWKFLKQPKDILVYDSGVSMIVYSRGK